MQFFDNAEVEINANGELRLPNGESKEMFSGELEYVRHHCG